MTAPTRSMIDRSATAQLRALRSGEISAKELMSATLDRIAAVNPSVNAIVALQDRDALMSAAEAAPDGPLQGLPVAVKDLADTAGIVTTYGSPSFKEHMPKADSAMVARLRRAGAVIIGKTNTPEWGLGSHCYNPVYGVTRNPYERSRSAGGSSGGAAVALAMRMTALADGSDMMGSLRNPAGWNNVYGLRPSYGLVANDGPGDIFSNQLSTSGPMARTVRDLELLLRVQSEHDPRHPHSVGPYRPVEKIERLRIGWLADWGGAYPMEDGVQETCAQGLTLLQELGHVVEVVKPPFSAAELWDSWTTLRSWAVADKLGILYNTPITRDDLKPAAIWEIEQGRALSPDAIRRAHHVQSQWFRTTADMDVDMLALPSAQLFPFPAEWDWPKEVAGTMMDTYHRWMEVVVPASLTGLPAVCVPTGFGPAGLPIGLQLIAHRGGDGMLLALARNYDEAQNWTNTYPDEASLAQAH